MEKIVLLPVLHRDAEQILIKSPDVKNLDDAIKKIKGAKWSQTYKSWYLPLNKHNYELIHQTLQPLAILDVETLKQYLIKKKKSG